MPMVPMVRTYTCTVRTYVHVYTRIPWYTCTIGSIRTMVLEYVLGYHCGMHIRVIHTHPHTCVRAVPGTTGTRVRTIVWCVPMVPWYMCTLQGSQGSRPCADSRTQGYFRGPSPQDVALRGVMQALVRIQAYVLADIVVAIPTVDLAIEAVV
jgi:hypothetical protein